MPQIKKRSIPIVYTVHDYKPVCPNYKMLSNAKPCEKCLGGKYINCLLNKCSKDSLAASLINCSEMYFHRLRKYYDLIDTYIAPSSFLANKLIEHGIPETKVIHIPNFVENKQAISKNGDGSHILYFGRLSSEKGVLTLIRAMQKVQNTRLRIAGTGPLEQKLEAYVEKNKLSNVHFEGFKTGADLEKLISHSLFTVLPSEWYENNPLSLLESFAHGKAVIGSNIGGIPELVKDGANGLLFEPGNAKDLAEKINRMVNNKQTAREMGLSAQSMINDAYSPQAYYERLIEIYEGLIA